MTDITKVTIAAVDQASEVFAKVQGSAERLQATYAKFAAFVAGAAGVGYFVHLIQGALDAAEQIDKLSQKTGIAVTTLSQLDYVAKLNGVSTDDLARGVKTLAQRMTEANDSTSKAGQLMRALGVDIAGGPDKAIEQLASKFAVLEDGTTKTALAVELFGKNGMAMIPMLNLGADGIRKLREESQALGLAYGPDFAKAASQFNDNMKAVEASTRAFWIALANELAPQLVSISSAMKEAAIEGGFLKAVLVGFGGVLVNLFTDENLNQAQKLAKQIRETSDALETYKNVAGEEGTVQQLQAELNSLKDKYRALMQPAVDAASAAHAFAGASADASKDGKSLSDTLKGILSPAAVQTMKAANDLNKALAQIFAKESGFTPDFGKQLALITEGFVTGAISAETYGAALEALIAQQPAVAISAKNLAEANKLLLESETALMQAMEKMRDLQQSALDQSHSTVEDAQFQLSLLGKTQAQIEQLTAARQADLELRRQAAEIPSEDGMSAEQAAVLEKLIAINEQHKAQIGLILNEKAAVQEQLSVWGDLGDRVGTFFSDLVTHGGSTIDKLRALFKQLLADMIKIFAQRWILQLGASAVGGAAGGALANEAGSVGANTLGGATNSLIGTGLSTAGEYLFGSAGTATAGGMIEGYSSGLIGSGGFAATLGTAAGGLAEGLGASAASAAAFGEAVAAAVPVIGWIVAIGMILYSVFGGKGGGPKTQGAFAGAFDATGNLTSTLNGPALVNINGDNQQAAAAQQMVQSLGTQYAQTVKALGGTASNLQLGLGFSIDSAGTAPGFIHGVVRDAQGNPIFQQFNDNASRDTSQFQGQVTEVMERMLVAALKSTDLPPAIAAVFKDIDPLTAAFADLDAAVKKALEIEAVTNALSSLGAKGLDITALQAWQRTGETLTQTFQRVAGQFASFDDAFLTDAQKLANAQTAVTGTFHMLGIAVPENTQALYDLVHGLDLGTQAGRDMFDALMQIAPAFLNVQNAAQSMIGSFNSIMGQLRPGYSNAALQSTLNTSLGEFGATHEWAAGWTSQYLLGQILTITPEDFANYVKNDPKGAQLINTILGTYAQMQQGTGAPAAASAVSNFTSGVDAAAAAAAQLAVALAQAKTGLGDYLSSLLVDKNLSPLSPLEQQEQARLTWVKDLQAASAGDVGAYQRLQGDASSLLGLARQNYGSSSQYVDLFKVVFDQMSILSGTPDFNTRMLKSSESQATTLVEVKAILMQIADSAGVHAGAIVQATTESASTISGAVKTVTVARR